MKVFISWSGQKSREVAVALRDWLPAVINSVEPFVSSEDIYAGTRWQMEIAGQLESTNFGIVCVTKDNQHAPWLNFEAGALAKAVDSSRVVPLAVDLKPTDVELPLGQFQAQPATKQGISAVVTSVNGACESPLADGLLDRAVNKWWPDLDAALAEIDERSAPTHAANGPHRTERELLEETLNTVRSLARGADGQPRPSTVPRDHPVIDELRLLLKDHEEGCEVLSHSRARRVGIRVEKEVPQDLREDLIRRAELYGVDVEFLPPRRLTAANAASERQRPSAGVSVHRKQRGANAEPPARGQPSGARKARPAKATQSKRRTNPKAD
jgi:hypothetical protein